MCSPCLEAHKQELREEYLERQLSEAISKERLLVAARKHVQGEEEAKKNYRNN